MPNSGHYWTTEEDQALLSAWQICGKSQLAFSREYAAVHNMTPDAVAPRSTMTRHRCDVDFLAPLDR